MSDSPCEPGEFFVHLYLQVEQVTPQDRTVCGKLSEPRHQEIAQILATDNGGDVVAELSKLLESIPPTQSKSILATKMAILRELDTAFLAIHPRGKHSSLGKIRPRWRWLSNALSRWYATGTYLEYQGRRLIPRGPLHRQARDESASSADTLADRFTALSVSVPTLDESGRKIEVLQQVVSAGGMRGVALGAAPGNERVAFLAVAQEPSDVLIECVNVNGVPLVDFRAGETLDVPTRVIDGLMVAGQADIVLAPELLIKQADADVICARMATLAVATRLFVAGSGHTIQGETDALTWNEARVVNQYGADLWRQRKLWQAKVAGQRCVDLGVSVAPGQHYAEYNDSGADLNVVDIQGLGRCVVLICQDLLAEPLVPELLRHYQPDWILVPIMDEDVKVGRWAHRTAFGVSHHSRARFLLVTNTAYARRLGKSEPIIMGLAVGPAQGSADEAGRLCAALPAEMEGGIEIARVQWGSGGTKWSLTNVAAVPSC